MQPQDAVLNIACRILESGKVTALACGKDS